MAETQAPTAVLDGTTQPCISCGEEVPAHQEFCGQCGTRQPAVADTTLMGEAPDAAGPGTTGLDLPALEAEATELVGTVVVFRSLSKQGRALRATPDPAAPVLPHFVVGRSTVVDARGAWVLLEHSSGTRGWCPVTRVKAPHQWFARTTDDDEPVAPPLAMVDGLERLHALHSAGGLSDDEFTRAKQVLLDASTGAG